MVNIGVHIILIIVIKVVICYNVDEFSAYAIKGIQENSGFGYAVQLWQDFDHKKWVVVGAPDTRRSLNDSSTRGTHYGIGGVVFCDLDNQCLSVDEIPKFTNDGVKNAVEIIAKSEHTSIGLGETIVVKKGGRGILLICTPRLPKTNFKNKEVTLRGQCYTHERGRKQSRVLSPFNDDFFYFDNTKFDILRMSSVNAGMSAAVTKKGVVLLGAPNLFYTSGGFVKGYNFRRSREYNTKYSRKPNYHEDDLYESWAITTGTFGGNPGQEFYAVSVFNQVNFLGKINFYSSDLVLQLHASLTEETEELGSRYGYSLTSADFDGDGADDLVVSAPWSLVVNGPQNELKDCGKVFIYYGPLKEDSKGEISVLNGFYSNGLFGFSIASPGDLDQDGYDELVVGAPFMDHGKIFIYSGSKEGLLSKPQIIEEKHLIQSRQPSPLSFGFSIGGGVDIDSNGFPDIIVGDKNANMAFVFRSAPVFKLQLESSFNNSAEDLYLGDKSCTIKNVKVTCFTMSVTLTFVTYLFVETKIPVDINIELDFKVTNSRLLFYRSHSRWYNKRIFISNSKAKNIEVHEIPIFVTSSGVSLLEPVEARVNVTYNKNMPDVRQQFDDNSKSALTKPFILPIVDKSSETIFETKSVMLICEGQDQQSKKKTCFTEPDLILTINITDVLIVGDKEPFKVNVTFVSEKGPGYNIRLEGSFPQQLTLDRVQLITSHDIRCLANEEKSSNLKRHIIDCTFSSNNYLPVDNKVQFFILLKHDPVKIIQMTEPVEFKFAFNLTSDSTKDVNIDNNEREVTVETIISTDIHLNSETVPETVSIKANDSKVEEKVIQQLIAKDTVISESTYVGPQFSHRYSLVNSGPAPIMDAKITIYWPAYRNGSRLTLFTDALNTSGPITCSELPESLIILKTRDGMPEQNGHDGTESTTDAPTQDYDSYGSLEDGFLYASTSDEIEEKLVRARRSADLLSKKDRSKKKDQKIIRDRTEINCNTATCITISCNVSQWNRRESVTIEFKAKAIAAAFKKIGRSQVLFKSLLKVHSTRYSLTRSKEASTVLDIQYYAPTAAERFLEQWWILFVTIAAGLIIIGLISAILFKVGFFKRKKLVRPNAPTSSTRGSRSDDPQFVLEATENLFKKDMTEDEEK